MNSSRMWTLGTVVAVVCVVGGTIGLGVQPALAAAASADALTVQVQAQIARNQVELTRIARVAARQADLKSESDGLLVAVPRALQLNVFSQDLRDVAALDRVQITVLSIAQPISYAPPVGTAGARATGSPAAAVPGSSSSPAPTASAATATGFFGRRDPLITAANFTEIPVTVTVTGDEASGIAFAEDAQRTKRLFAVNAVTFTKASGGSGSSTTVSGSMFALQR